MKKTFHTHLTYYISLAVLLILGFILIMLTGYDVRVQLTAVMLTAFFYVLWGVVHHIVHHDISAKIVVEYVLIAALGMLLAMLVLR